MKKTHNIPTFFLVTLLVTLFLATACGMSEGQSATLYLGSVTVHERRLEDDAVQLSKILESNADYDVISKKLKSIALSVNASKGEIENLQVPSSAEDIHKVYLNMFNTVKKRVDTASKLISPDIEEDAKAELRTEFEELGNKIEELDEKIREEKIAISKKYPEVQVPEAFEPENIPTDNSDSVH